MNAKKIIGLAVIIMMVANVFLFAFRIYGAWVFWTVIILGAIIAYALPKINPDDAKGRKKK